jgi:hypothetical protein
MEALRGSRLEIEARVARPDGDVVVTALQFVFFDPPGVTSALGGAMVASVRHMATLRRTSEGWRLVGWTPEFLEAHATRPGR